MKLTVDKWFVDKGFGFGKAPSGEVVFIHASVVQGAEVLVVGTEAWTQVVSDHARAEGRISSPKGVGPESVEGGKGQREGKPSGAASETRSSTDGGNWQFNRRTKSSMSAAILQDCLMSHWLQSADTSSTTAPPCSPPPLNVRETPASTLPVNNKPPQEARVSHLAGSFTVPRPRSSTRAQDNAAVLEETLRLFVEATGKDDASMRQQTRE